MSTRVLVVDDEPSMLEFLDVLLTEEGYRVTTARSLAEGRARWSEREFGLVICDLMMPDGSGLELLEAIRGEKSNVSVIMMTAYTSTRSAIEAMKLGAYDYLSKPFDVDEIKLTIRKAIEKTELADENVYLRRELEGKYKFSNIIGRGRRMQEIFALVERVARTSSTILLEGESGTGKELIARAIHYAGPRSKQRFLSVNCGAMPENLLESELFGHKRGAFTGAVTDKKGLFQAAHQGTLLLDEIGEMTPPMQVKLLRALQEKRVRRVGGNTEEPVDARIVAATNQDLRELIRTGAFREDLYYRINVIPIRVPPLRERREDIPLLVDFFIQKYSKELQIEPPRIAVEALKLLENYRWPGNVRELENVIERALALITGDTLTGDDIPTHLLHQGAGLRPAVDLPQEGLDLEAHLDDVRRELMMQALDRCDGVQTRAAELLSMSFRSFRYYAKKAGLTKDALEQAVES
ncbi:MAG: sigma-54 dependent transcriptional regulator [Acidobacteriota bacterium]|nr:sigma-54 dependent transcriptional regulator [Acidobacteriota bacterium]MDH3524756.1 sigma-54 dependent transcriptional regulator [Acidobacteriota bacterium]